MAGDGASGPEAYVAQRLDHLGMVAGVCREMGLAAWLDGQDEQSHERVGVGTATVAMILNGLGFSNRRLDLVPQFFANKPVERLLGPGITAEDLTDACLGRARGWLYAHDATTLFAGIALRARRAFGIRARHVHVDTTSFAVTGDFAAEREDLDAHTIAVTYGSSRDHRADLKQWMLALATTRQGDLPLFCQALDGKASDQVSLVAAVEALATQLRAAAETEEHPAEAPLLVADSGRYRADNVARLSAAGVRWISRVPETSQEARAALEVAEDAWQHADDAVFWAPVARAPTGERWLVVRSTPGRSALGRRCSGRLSRRARSGSGPCGIWATARSPVPPMRRRPSISNSRRVRRGFACRRGSSAMRRIVNRAVPAKACRQTTKRGRSRRP